MSYSFRLPHYRAIVLARVVPLIWKHVVCVRANDPDVKRSTREGFTEPNYTIRCGSLAERLVHDAVGELDHLA